MGMLPTASSHLGGPHPGTAPHPNCTRTLLPSAPRLGLFACTGLGPTGLAVAPDWVSGGSRKLGSSPPPPPVPMSFQQGAGDPDGLGQAESRTGYWAPSPVALGPCRPQAAQGPAARCPPPPASSSGLIAARISQMSVAALASLRERPRRSLSRRLGPMLMREPR